MTKLRWISIAVIALIAGWWFFGRTNHDTPPQAAPSVVIASPKKQLLTEWDEYTGRFLATQRVEIRSRVSGYLQEVRFKDGQRVKKGETLFVIDQRPFRIALEQARARFALTEKEYNRAKGLRATNAASQQTLDERTALYVEAKAMLEEAALNLTFSEITSPISGRVGRHLVDAGNLVTGGDSNATLLTTIVQEDPIHFYFEASEQDLLKYARLDAAGKRVTSRDEAKPVQVKLQDETAFVHHGVMDFVDNQIDNATGSIQGRAIFDNKDGLFISGLFGRLRIAGSGEYEALLIPDEAVGTNQNQKIVFMVNEKNIVEPRPVVLGPLHEGKWRIVRSGITAEDKIIWAGLAKVRPNMTVTPTPLEAQKEQNDTPQAPMKEAK